MTNTGGQHSSVQLRQGLTALAELKWTPRAYALGTQVMLVRVIKAHQCPDTLCSSCPPPSSHAAPRLWLVGCF